MRVTFVMQFTSLAGGNRVIALYARKLMERGHEVTVVSHPFIPPSRLKRLFYTAIGKPHKVKMKQASPLFDALGDRHVVLDRPRPATADDLPDADAVFATWWRTAPVVAGLPASKGAKFYLLQDYETFDYLPQEQVAATYQMPLHKIAVSGYIADQVRNNHGPAEIDIVPNAVDQTLFSAPERDRGTPLTIGFLYSPAPRKNIALAVEAARLARARLPGLRVLAFGANVPMPSAPMPDWIEYHRAPPQTEIPRLYAQCDLWLFTSHHEGFGLPLLEAMACRTPVLATRAGAAPDLIDGQNGQLIDSDPEAFAQQIAHYGEMPPEAWRAASQAAFATAQRYSWNHSTDLLVDILNKRRHIEAKQV